MGKKLNIMNKFNAVFFLSVFFFQNGLFSQSYFPPPGKEWQTAKPAEVGVDASKLQIAVTFAMENEYSGSKDLRLAILKSFSREPYHEILGPTKKRGGPAGLILKNGYVIAHWGDIDRVT